MSFGSESASRLAGKTILITGASSGIGQATAVEYARVSGGKIKLILAARRLERLLEIKKQIDAQFPDVKVLPLVLDVSDIKGIPGWVSEIPKEFSDVDILINNAGLVHGMEHIGDIKQPDINVMFDTNVLGLIALTQAFVPKFKASNKGDIVNIGSIAGREPYPGGGIYCATKAAVKAFTTSLRKELTNTRIRVIEVDPGQVETEFSLVRFRGDKSKADAVYAGGEPLLPDDIAEVIVFATSRRENVVIADTLVFPSMQGGSQNIYKSK